MINHDYAHCWDYEKGVCPENCFRAELTEDLKNWPHPVTYAKFKGTEACLRTNPNLKYTRADRIRAMTDEELADWLVMVEQRIIEVNPMLERPALYADWLEWLKEEAES